jgi:hypothetical protein
LEGGSPTRPLAKDAVLGLSFKFESKLEFVGGLDTRALGTKFTSKFVGATPFSFGMIVEPRGAMRVYSRDPRRARLVIKWHGITRSLGRGASNEPQTINMALLGDVLLDGVLFDYVKAGGIALRDLALKDRWRNVYFGQHNAAPPQRLFTVFDPQARAWQQSVVAGGE